MKAQIKLFKIFGIQIGLHYSWLLIAVLVVFSLAGQFAFTNPEWGSTVIWGLAILTALLFFAAIVVHELSHAAVAKARGLPVRSITLFALGGVAQIEKEASDAKTEFWMGIAGPITSAVIGIICLGIAAGIGWTPSGSHQAPLAAHVLVALHRHHRIGQRLPELVDHAAGHDAAARQREVDFLDELAVENLERLARLERTLLAVLQLNVAALARVYGVASGQDFFELVLSVGIRRGQTVFAKLGREDSHLRLAQRLPCVCGDDVAAQRRGSGFRRLSRIARRHAGHRRLDALNAWLHVGPEDHLLAEAERRNENEAHDPKTQSRHHAPRELRRRIAPSGRLVFVRRRDGRNASAR